MAAEIEGRREFVLCVGSVGTGKSSTIARCLRHLGGRNRNVVVGDGVNSVTFESDVFFAMYETNLAFVDTRGWNDSSAHSDKQVFIETLRFLKSKELLRAKAIVWNIAASVRETKELERQAKFIDQFVPRRIWSNVIIVCKEAKNPIEQSRGAVRCSNVTTIHAVSRINFAYFRSLVKRLFNGEPNMQVLGFTYLEAESRSLSHEQKEFARGNPEMRRLYNILTDDEVGKVVVGAINRIKAAIDIELRDAKCEACGIVDDPRLMPRQVGKRPIALIDPN